MSEDFQKNYISLAEASKISGYHPDYLGFLCRDGKLEGFKLGRNWFTTKNNLERFLNSTASDSQKEILLSGQTPTVERVHHVNVHVQNSIPAQLANLKLDIINNIESRVTNISQSLNKLEEGLEKVNTEQKKIISNKTNFLATPAITKPVSVVDSLRGSDGIVLKNDLRQKFSSALPVVNEVSEQKNFGNFSKFSNLFSFDINKKILESFKSKTSFEWSWLGLVVLTLVTGFSVLTAFLNVPVKNFTEVVYRNSGGVPIGNNVPDTGTTTVVVYNQTFSGQKEIVVKNSEVSLNTIAGIIDARLNSYLEEGKFKGERGEQGLQGPTGPAGSSGGSTVTVYAPNPQTGFGGGTNFSSTFFSADTATINTLNVNNFNPGFTAGSVLFQGGGALAEDNANFYYSGGQLSVGTSTPDISALLQLESTSKGFLAPRMTTAERDSITSPATGLLVYNTTTNAYNFYNGSAWSAVGTGSGSGGGGVDTGITGSFAYYQTATATVSPQSSLFYSSGSLGVGTSTPLARLQVVSATTSLPGLSVVNASGQTANLFELVSSTGTVLSVFDPLGRIGIGTSTPSAPLTIQSAPHEKIRLAGTATGTQAAAYMSFYPNGADRWGYFGFTSHNSDFVELANEKSGTTRRLILHSDGSVGINTTSPVALLTVQGYSGSTVALLNIASSSGASLFSVSSAGNASIVGTLNVTATTTLSSATTTINGITYYWPSAQSVGTKILQNDGTGRLSWVADQAGGGGSLSGGTVGFVMAWASSTGATTGILRDNGTVAGVNATSSTVTFNIQGAAGDINPFVVASSTGVALFTIAPSGSTTIANLGTGLVRSSSGSLYTDNTTYLTSASADLLYPSFTYASTTFPSFGYASSTFATAANLLSYPTFTYGSSTYVNFGYATNTFATLLNTPTFTYGSSTYVNFGYATNTFATLLNTPTFTYGSSTYVNFGYATNTFATLLNTPSYTYGSSTYVNFAYATNTFATIANYPSYTYATNTFATLLNTPSYTYGSSTYVNFGYATNTFATLLNTPSYTYASTTFPSFSYATNTFATLLNTPSYTYASSSYATAWNLRAGSNITITTSTPGIITLAATDTGLTSLSNLTGPALHVATTSDTNIQISISTTTANTLTFIPGWTGSLATARGGTGTTTWQTGAIPFYNGSNFTENIGNLLWDNTNARLGIGSSTPIARLSVQSSDSTTPLLSIASSTSGSIFHVGADGRVGIGRQNPSNTLDVNGGITTTQTGGLTVGSEGLIYGGSNVFNIRGTANVDLVLMAGNSEKVRIKSATGNVGIGTATPTSLLQVAGDLTVGSVGTANGRIVFRNNSNANTVTLLSTTTLASNLILTLPTTTPSLGQVLSSTANGELYWSTASAGSLSGSGAVGKLAVWDGTSSLTNSILFDNGTVAGINATSSTVLFNLQGTSGSTNNIFNISSSTGISILAVTENQRVGVGTSSPIATFTVQGTSTYPNINPFVVASSSGTQLLTVLPSGNVGVGISSPSAKLHVSGADMKTVGTATLNGGGWHSFVQGRYSYVVNYSSSTLQIIDVSNSLSPATISSSDSSLIGSNPISVYVSGRYAYVVNDSSNRLRIIDISNPASPFLVSNIAIGTSPQSVYVQGRYAYIVHWSSAFRIYDISDPYNPSLVSSLSTGGTNQRTVVVLDKYAYISNYGSDSIQVVDVSNPAGPFVVSTLSTDDRPWHFAVQGRYGYVANYGSSTLAVVDFSNPVSPSIIATTTTNGGPRYVSVDGNYVYVVNAASSTMQAFDVSNPASPSLVSTISTLGEPYSVSTQGRYAYIVNRNTSESLQVVDLGSGYIQQLEAGGFETGTLAVRQNASIGYNLSVLGAIQAAQGGAFMGPVSIFSPTTTTTSIFRISASSTYPNIFTVLGTGRVGIGSGTPSTMLAVQGDGIADLFNIASSSGISILRVTSNQRVGVGTSSPIATFTVQGTSTYPTINPFVVASSSGTSLFTVANNGSTTINSLGTGLVRSSSGSLYTDNTTYLTSALTSLSNLTGPALHVATTSDTNIQISISTTTANTLTFIPGWTGSLATARGGTGTTTWQTGAIPFYNGSNFTENIGNLLWDNTNARLGIGSSTPIARLSIESQVGEIAFAVGSSTRTNFIVNEYGSVGVGTHLPGNGSSAFSNGLHVVRSGSPFTLGSGYAAIFQDSSGSGENGEIVIVSGTNANASVYLTDTGDNDIGGIEYHNSSNSLGFRVNNVSDRILIDSSGNVGIATTSPSSKLQVVGDIQIGSKGSTTPSALIFNTGSLSNQNTVTLLSTTTLASNLILTLPTTTPSLGQVLSSTANGELYWSTASAGSLSGSGAVGKLAVWDGTSSLTNSILFDNGTVAGINATSSTVLFNLQGTSGSTNNIFNVASSTGISILTATSNQRVGVGTSSPIATLTVQGTSTYPTINPFVVASSNGTSLLTVLPSGNVGIGLSSPVKPFHVYGNTSNGIALFERQDTNNTGQVVTFIVQADSNGVSQNGFGPLIDFYQKNNGSTTLGSFLGSLSASKDNGDDDTGNISIYPSNNGVPSIVASFNWNRTVGINTTSTSSIITIASSTGASQLTVGYNGSTTLASLGTGLVRSSSGSLYTDNTTYLTSALTSLSNLTGPAIHVATTSDTNIQISISTTTANTLTFIPSWTGSLAVGRGGTGTTTWQTGAIPFYNGSNFTENIGNLLWDNTNARLGIGSSTPIARLSVQSSDSTTPLLSIASSTSGSILHVGADGRVGIGTTSPVSNFAVGSGQAVFQGGSASLPGVAFADATGTGMYRTSGAFGFSTAGTSRLTISASTISANTQFAGTDGSASAPSYAFNNNSTMGMFRIGSGILGFSTVSTERMRIDSSGNVGIATTSPSSALQVVGDIQIGSKGSTTPSALIFNTGSLSNQNTVTLLSTTTLASNLILTLPTTTPSLGQVLSSTANGELYWSTASAGSLSGSGAVGKLAVWDGTSSLTNSILFDNGTVAGINATSSTVLFNLQGTSGSTNNIFNVASSTGISILTATSNQRVGVGTSSPIATLTVQGTSTYPTINPFVVASSSGTRLLTVDVTGTVAIANKLGLGTTTPSNSTAPYLRIVSVPGTDVEHIFSGPNTLTGYNYINYPSINTFTQKNNSAISDTALSALSEVYNSNINETRGIIGSVESINSSGTVQSIVGVLGTALHRGTGSTTDVTAILADASAVWGNVTNLYGLRIMDGSASATTTNNYGIYIGDQSGTTATNNYQLYSNGAGVNPFVITSLGNVGIGTSTPNATLFVQGVSSAPTLNPFVVASSSGSQLFTVLPGGNVGIGTSNPTSLLEVSASQTVLTTPVTAQLRVRNDGSASNNALLAVTSGSSGESFVLLGDSDNDDIGFIGYNNLTNQMRFSTAANDRMVINNVGYVGINSSTPIATLSVKGIAGAINPFMITSSTDSSLFTVGYTGSTTIANLGTGLVRSSNGSLYTDATTYLSSIGSGNPGFVSIWNGTNAFTQGLIRDNGTVAGINATSSASYFNIQGASNNINLLAFASSTGDTVLKITAFGGIVQTINSSTAVSIQDTTGIKVFEVDTSNAATQAGIDITAGGSQTANLLNFYSSADLFLLGVSRSGGIIQNIASTTAFTLQNGSGVNFFNVDTSGSKVGIGTSTGMSALDIFSDISITETGNPSQSSSTATGLRVITSDNDSPSALIWNTSQAPCIGQATGCTGAVAAGSPGILTIQANATTTATSSWTRFNLITAFSAATRSPDTAVFRVRGDGAVFSENAYSTSGADYAEYFDTFDTSLEAGDIVIATTTDEKLLVAAITHAGEATSSTSTIISSLDSGDITEAQEESVNSLEVKTKLVSAVMKSQKAYDSKILGIVSANPAFIGNNPSGRHDQNQFKKVVGLVGRVPVKVTNENGNIQVGDYITTSGQFNGFGMKATRSGNVLGIALESFNGDPETASSAHSAGTVLVFIEPGFQNINNTFVMEDTQVTGVVGLGVPTSTPNSFIIDQRGSGNLLQIQKEGMDKFVINNQGTVQLFGQVNQTAPVLTVITASTSVFSISAKGDLYIKGQITVGKDTAGTAEIATGDNQVEVEFETPYTEIPKVVVTAQGVPNFFYGVVSKTKKGFVIKTSAPVTETVKFDWIALSQPETTSSDSGSSINVVSEPPSSLVPESSPESEPETSVVELEIEPAEPEETVIIEEDPAVEEENTSVIIEESVTPEPVVLVE